MNLVNSLIAVFWLGCASIYPTQAQQPAGANPTEKISGTGTTSSLSAYRQARRTPDVADCRFQTEDWRGQTGRRKDRKRQRDGPVLGRRAGEMWPRP